jgi:hypothetical protein
MTMPFEELEQVYERLAAAIDEAGEGSDTLFLTKLVLLLAQRHADGASFEACVRVALRDLPSAVQRE